MARHDDIGQHQHHQTGEVMFMAASDGEYAHVHLTFPEQTMCFQVREAERLAAMILRVCCEARVAQAVRNLGDRLELSEADVQTLYELVAGS